MTTANTITSIVPPEFSSVGIPMQIPEDKQTEISLILRMILALSDSDTQGSLFEGESYDTVYQKLKNYRVTLKEVSAFIREVTEYAH